jgi:AcrR family transcriptional regulator
MNLRERRRIETRDLIQRSAFELARARGVDAVTVEAICETAGVSLRTFFNYFPFKEAVFVAPIVPLPEAAVATFLAATGDLMEGLAELMAAHAVEIQKTRWMGEMMREIAQVHPRVMPLQMAEFQKFDRQIKDVIATRLGAAADDTACEALAGAVLGANRGTIDRWMADPELDLPAAIRAGIRSMVSIIRTTGTVPAD